MSKVLIACEFSGIVREAFTRQGHDAWSCDLFPTEIEGQHIQDDVLKYLDEGWDLMIAHPPCQYLSVCGAHWLHKQPGRRDKMLKAAQFFGALWRANIPRIAIENSVPHRQGIEPVAGKYTQIIQPWQHGHGEQKRTCLWLKGLPLLRPSNVVPGRALGRYNISTTNSIRWMPRSRSYEGIAEAMAEQWGGLL